jgi:hypothetical protein
MGASFKPARVSDSVPRPTQSAERGCAVSFEPRNAEAYLFGEGQKAEEHHADFSGEIAIDDRRFWIRAWENTSKNGRRYLKVVLRPKLERGRAPA